MNPLKRLIFLLYFSLAFVAISVLAGDCGGSRIVTSLSGIITDGEGPYVGGTVCRWHVKAPPGHVVSLIFKQFDTECSWDYLHVVDGDHDTGVTVAALSGFKLPSPIISTTNVVYVTFSSEDNTENEGFNITYVASPCPYNCSEMGTCVSGACQCNPSRHGNGCQYMDCPRNCSGHGVCDLTNSSCTCDPGFTGRDCSVDTDRPYWMSPLPDSPTPLVGTTLIHLEETKQLVAFSSFLYDAPFGGMLWYNFTAPGGWILGEDPAIRPEARSDHLVVHAGGHLYVLGGRLDSGVADDFWKFDLQGGTWTEVSATGRPPPAFGSRGVFIEDLRVIVVFGGQTTTRVLSSEVYQFNVDTETWTHVDTQGTKPPGLVFSLVVYDEDRKRMLIHGGASSSGISSSYSSALYSYSPYTNIFTLLSPQGTVPPALYNHGGAILGDYLLVSSGSLSDCTASDLYAFSLLCNTWTLLQPSFAGKDGSSITHTRRTSFAAFTHNGLFHMGGGFSGALRSDILRLMVDRCSWIAMEETCAQTAGCAWQTDIGNSSWCLETAATKTQGTIFSELGGDSSLCPACDAYRNSLDCSLSEKCTWCSAASQCVPLSPSNSSEVPHYTVGNCSTNDPCEVFSSCNTCSINPECSWCAADGACIGASSIRPGCMAGGTKTCADPCEMMDSCGSCLSGGLCGWCEFSNVCYSPGRQCPQQSERFFRTSCPAACSTASSCLACASLPQCVWCNNLQTCSDASVYTTSYPYGKCASFAYGPLECPAPCSSYTRCDSCVENTNCGWCAGNATLAPGCLSGDYFQPTDASLCSPWNWTQVSTSCQAQPTKDPTSCNCNGHSSDCSIAGICLNCMHSTRNGPANACDICASSNYYGSPLNGGTCWYSLHPDLVTNLSCGQHDFIALRTLGSLHELGDVYLSWDVIVGSGRLYYSFSNQKPNASSYDGYLEPGNSTTPYFHLKVTKPELFLAVYPTADITFALLLSSAAEPLPSQGLGLLFYLVISFTSLFVFLFLVAFGYKVRQHIQTRGQRLVYEMSTTKPYTSVRPILCPPKAPTFQEGTHPLQTPVLFDPLGDTGRIFLATVLVQLPTQEERQKFAFGHAVVIRSKLQPQQQQQGK